MCGKFSTCKISSPKWTGMKRKLVIKKTHPDITPAASGLWNIKKYIKIDYIFSLQIKKHKNKDYYRSGLWGLLRSRPERPASVSRGRSCFVRCQLAHAAPPHSAPRAHHCIAHPQIDRPFVPPDFDLWKL